MRKEVMTYVQQCTVCQQQKASQRSSAGLLQPRPIPTQVWSQISMDFIEGLLLSCGIDTVLVVVDRFTKYAHFLGLKHPFNAFKVASLFIKEVVHLHGFPESIISDRDRIFWSTFWRELFKLYGTSLKKSTSYHPQTDGQSEIVNKCLETYLRCFISNKPKKWAKWLHWAEFSYNTSPHISMKFSPFKALYGRDPPYLIRLGNRNTTVGRIEELLHERDAILDDLQFNLIEAQQTMKAEADLKRRDESLEVDELVYLKLQPYRQRSLARKPIEKLAARFYGPCRVIKKIGKVAYQLQLPAEAQIHPVFHVSQLKRSFGSDGLSP